MTSIVTKDKVVTSPKKNKSQKEQGGYNGAKKIPAACKTSPLPKELRQMTKDGERTDCESGKFPKEQRHMDSRVTDSPLIISVSKNIPLSKARAAERAVLVFFCVDKVRCLWYSIAIDERGC